MAKFTANGRRVMVRNRRIVAAQRLGVGQRRRGDLAQPTSLTDCSRQPGKRQVREPALDHRLVDAEQRGQARLQRRHMIPR